MMPEYKQIMQVVAHCPICKEQLRGNGSGVLPYICKCGEWEYVKKNGVLGEFKIKTQ